MPLVKPVNLEGKLGRDNVGSAMLNGHLGPSAHLLSKGADPSSFRIADIHAKVQHREKEWAGFEQWSSCTHPGGFAAFASTCHRTDQNHRKKHGNGCHGDDP